MLLNFPLTKFSPLIYLVLALYSNFLTVVAAKKSKELRLIEPRPYPDDIQFPPDELYNAINFTDLSTRRVEIKAIFVKPCYFTKKIEKRGGCGLEKGKPALIDVRFTGRGEILGC